MTGSHNSSPRELLHSVRYAALRAAVSGVRLAALVQAEDEIAEDPLHRHWRWATIDGATLEFFAADAGLIIKFRPMVDGRLSIEDLLDRGP